MKVGVRIMPRAEVLDSQGRAVERTLKTNGMNVSACRVGKYVELDIAGKNKESVELETRKIVEFVLINPLIENYEIEFLEN